jgi:hypothetical protein
MSEVLGSATQSWCKLVRVEQEAREWALSLRDRVLVQSGSSTSSSTGSGWSLLDVRLRLVDPAWLSDMRPTGPCTSETDVRYLCQPQFPRSYSEGATCHLSGSSWTGKALMWAEHFCRLESRRQKQAAWVKRLLRWPLTLDLVNRCQTADKRGHLGRNNPQLGQGKATGSEQFLAVVESLACSCGSNHIFAGKAGSMT